VQGAKEGTVADESGVQFVPPYFKFLGEGAQADGNGGLVEGICLQGLAHRQTVLNRKTCAQPSTGLTLAMIPAPNH